MKSYFLKKLYFVLIFGSTCIQSSTSFISTCADFLSLPKYFVSKTQNLKIALCQIDTTVGDFDYNVRHILRFIEKAGELGAEIAVFPEMVLSSYPPRDFLDQPHFVSLNEKALQILQSKIKTIPHAPRTIILGSIRKNPSKVGRALQNSAIIIENGDLIHEQAKQLLPSYDVFDESRYFEPGKKTQAWASKWGKFSCGICEDAWSLDTHQGQNLYTKDPAQEMKRSLVSFQINASPYQKDKYAHRQQVLSGFAQRASIPVVYVNQVGAQDDILFDGRSFVLSETGTPIFEMPSFQEAIARVDLRVGGGKSSEVLWSKTLIWKPEHRTWNRETLVSPETELDILEKALIEGIRGYFYKVGYDKAILGLSGGIDSSVVAALATKALGAKNVIGVSMPSKYSSNGSLLDAEALAKNLGIHYIVAPIEKSVSRVQLELEKPFETLSTQSKLQTTQEDTTEDNIQARLRAVLLSALANKFDALVLTTSNKSELAVGQTTIYGDMAGALAPIGDLFKTYVYKLARHMNRTQITIPISSIDKPASAELAPGQTDEAKFGAWSQLDPILEMYIEKHMSAEEIIARGHDKNYVQRTLKILDSNEFKRRLATIILKTSGKAYGSGRRIPVSSFFRPAR